MKKKTKVALFSTVAGLGITAAVFTANASGKGPTDAERVSALTEAGIANAMERESRNIRNSTCTLDVFNSESAALDVKLSEEKSYAKGIISSLSNNPEGRECLAVMAANRISLFVTSDKSVDMPELVYNGESGTVYVSSRWMSQIASGENVQSPLPETRKAVAQLVKGFSGWMDRVGKNDSKGVYTMVGASCGRSPVEDGNNKLPSYGI